MANGSRQGRVQDQPHYRRLRDRSGRFLAGPLAKSSRHRGPCHSCRKSVSREHRRPKTDRLDIRGLKRAFLGWLRGERDHCKMAAIPTFAEEDAKRPNREHETLVGERTSIVNRMKATLTRLGIRNFNPKLKKAAERLVHVRTPEGEPIPPNTLAELQRDMEPGGSSWTKYARLRRRGSSV